MKVSLLVSGHVQGVGFRYMTKIKADNLGVLGSVRNKANGDVYIEATGNEAVIREFIDIVKNSPAPFGRVDHVTINYLDELEDYRSFSICY
ncbi:MULTISPECIES: acylphosphatase [Vagococcus]|uniref:acylphosphatase n=1 Tax=Vagococcus fluvialis bH819 TaxID=1255619 RepID=A0A1X6WRB7_9ENTE|nr:MULTISPECIES: acylphosphatase [Vagococcus]SLM86799.1 Predicted nucleoside phosphatase [Vagococcus fluvialis bH819]HCM88742.1 acylphosphatase [Vagococcus sp.]